MLIRPSMTKVVSVPSLENLMKKKDIFAFLNYRACPSLRNLKVRSVDTSQHQIVTSLSIRRLSFISIIRLASDSTKSTTFLNELDILTLDTSSSILQPAHAQQKECLNLVTNFVLKKQNLGFISSFAKKKQHILRQFNNFLIAVFRYL